MKSTFTFPLKFATVYTAVASSYTNAIAADLASGFVYNLTATSCEVVHERNYGYTILAIGKG